MRYPPKSKLKKEKGRTAQFVKEVEDILEEMPRGVFRTITSDNGLGFSRLYEFEENDKFLVYYAHPYASYERGSNEINNRLIRRHYKKGKYIKNQPEEKVKYVEDWMNNMPRRLFGYRTANELYKEE